MKVYKTIYGINIFNGKISQKNANTFCIGKVLARKNTQKITVTKFLAIFQNCDCYGKDAIFLHFFNRFFSEFTKMDILKMSKKRFSKHFCMFIFNFLGSLL